MPTLIISGMPNYFGLNGMALIGLKNKLRLEVFTQLGLDSSIQPEMPFLLASDLLRTGEALVCKIDDIEGSKPATRRRITNGILCILTEFAGSDLPQCRRVGVNIKRATFGKHTVYAKIPPVSS